MAQLGLARLNGVQEVESSNLSPPIDRKVAQLGLARPPSSVWLRRTVHRSFSEGGRTVHRSFSEGGRLNGVQEVDSSSLSAPTYLKKG